MSKSFVLINLNERNSLLNTILTICICGLIVLIFSIISYLLYCLLKHIYTKKCINTLPQDMASDDKQLWINDRIFNEIRHINRADNAYKLSRILQCILPQGQTTPERILSNPWYDKGFCEPNQYKAAIDRCKGGFESCELFIDIFSERAKIERNYIADLEKWSTTSIKEISQSKEFGTNKKAWMDSIRASKEIANTHADIVQRLQDNVIDKMVNFKKENYGRSILHVKKIKEFEHDFEQVQKSWIKLLDKINKAKKDYHDAHRQLKRAETAEQIIDSDRGAEEEQKQKLKLSVSSYKKQAEALRSKYEQYISDMTNTRPNYENSMKEVLDRTHTFERKRLAHFQLSFTALHQSLVIDKDPHLVTMNESFKKAIESVGIEKDIQWWNSHFGSDTNTAWPKFEEPKD